MQCVCVESTCKMGEKRSIVVVFLFDRYFEEKKIGNEIREMNMDNKRVCVNCDWVNRKLCVYLEVFP